MGAHRHRQVSSGRPGSATPAGISPTQEAIVRAIEGPFITATELSASGDAAASWFDPYYNTMWNRLWDYADVVDFIPGSGAVWDAGNSTAYYEQGSREFVEWIRFNDSTHFDRARAINASYRDDYLIPSGYTPVAHYMALRGLTLDWLVAGDAASRDTVLNVANTMVPLYAFDTSYVIDSPDSDNRIWARILDAAWMWEKIQGTPMLRPDSIPYIDNLIPRMLALQNTSGFFPLPSYCGGSMNWIQAHFFSYLMKIHDDRPGSYNAAIEASVAAFGNYLWNDPQWLGAPTYSFNYITLTCPSQGSPGPAPDINGFFLPMFGWLGKHVDPVWWSRADLILSGMKLNADNTESFFYVNLPHYKQFTESYSYSYRYFGYRYVA